jgi:TolB-like protein/DNA-binding winged helix-turn-helix (wHTH) protein/Tfp pilus assembly protein PilF
MNALEQGFQLEELRVDPQSGEVSGPAGLEKLDRKVMDVLLHMARHAGHVVAREELLTTLWPGTVVTDDALTRCFYELRRHLSHAGGDERYRTLVETHPKRGYRLNGTVVPLAPEAGERAPAPGKRFPTWVVATGAAVLLAVIGALLFTQFRPARPGAPSTAPENSIAVLPFLDMSAEKDQAYFSDGVTEEILHRLSQADNLIVIARTSSFSFQDESLDVPEIGTRLNVAYVLEGSVRKAGNRVRITAQLIDVSTNSHVWSKTYDRVRDDLFTIEDEIAGSVATALQVTLADGRLPGRASENLEAYERFLRGHYFYNRRAAGDIERAAANFEESVALDPRYARAWASLSGTYSLLAAAEPENEASYRELQGKAALKAVELKPNLAVAHARISQYYYHIAQRSKAEEHLRTAVSLDPNDPLVLGHTSSRAVWSGDFKTAVALWRRIAQQDPLSPTVRGNFAMMLLMNGQLDEALAEQRKVLEINPQADPDVQAQIVQTLVLLQRYDEAWSVTARIPPGKEKDYAIALQHEVPGRRAEADAALTRLAAVTNDFRSTIHVADVYMSRGMTDEAFSLLEEERDALERDKDQRSYPRWYFQEQIRMSPYLKQLHSDPRWPALTARPE